MVIEHSLLHAPVSIVFSRLLYVMHLQRYSTTRWITEAIVRLSDANTAAVPYMDYWYVFCSAVQMIFFALHKYNYSCCTVAQHWLLIVFYLSNILLLGVLVFFFDTTRGLIQLRPSPRVGGGASGTAPFLKRHSTFNIKPNTADARELSPLLYSSEHRGR